MEIFLSQPCGFCFGGKRTVDIANNIGSAYTLGPLLHNEQLVEQLKQKGVTPISFEELMEKDAAKEGKQVIIRAHGVPEEQLSKLKEKGFDVIDGTCPKVKNVYDIASMCEEMGCQVFVFGDKDHAEVKGIVSRLKNPIVVKGVGDIPDKSFEKIGLVSQTTQRKEKYEEVKNALEKKCKVMKAFDTICTATQERQDSAASLASEVDAMVVIGGKESSNTKKLFEVCKGKNGKVFMIQTKDDLEKEWFDGFSKVGIAAGASTPDFVVKEAIEELKKF